MCQLYKQDTQEPTGKLQTVVAEPWEMLGVDIMGPFPRSSNGNVYLLVFVDYFSGFVALFPLRKAIAETVSHMLTKEILTHWGVISDQGSQFVPSVFEETWTSYYHPQTSLTERINCNIMGQIPT